MSPKRSKFYLIDSTIWVRFLRGQDPALKEKLSALIFKDKALTTEIIIMEILRGAVSKKEFDYLRDDFTALPKVSMDTKSWNIAWRLGFELRKSGLTLPAVDGCLASIAMANNLVILHSDKHFKMIAEKTQLKQESC
jgi:hypothetical protein